MNVLNVGFVKLVDSMGDDDTVASVARRCWRSEDKANPQSDKNLIKHLLQSGHKTPFEFMSFVFDVKAPLFIARQWMRHRVGGFAEESLRYCEVKPEFWIPDGLDSCDLAAWNDQMNTAFTEYNYCVSSGMKREQARALLPMGTYTKFYWVVNGSSLMNFLRLRLDKAAQSEIRQYAIAIVELVEPIAPITLGIFMERLDVTG